LTTTRARFFTELALSAAVIFGAPSASGAQQLESVPSETAPNGFPAARCSRPADQEALRIKQLVEFVEKSAIMKPSSRRAADASNPLRPGESCCRRSEFRIRSPMPGVIGDEPTFYIGTFPGVQARIRPRR
jgi:hypothetical protein